MPQSNLTQTEFDVLYYIFQQKEIPSLRKLATILNVSLGNVSTTLKELKNKGFLDNISITKAGIQSLKPYKVDNAIILAAGTSSRFVPLSYNSPKALLNVKGEVLIEREIRQLQEAGIQEIYVVLGYKKEMLFYLEEKFNVKLIINPYYMEKNNLTTLELAKKYICNSYICCSDQYFVSNPFKNYVYSSFYGYNTTTKSKRGLFITVGSHDNIIKAKTKQSTGKYLTGPTYWNNEFSDSFMKLVTKHNLIGDYDNTYWEHLYADNVTSLPKLIAKANPTEEVFEFNSIDELREFDSNYIDDINSKILFNICSVFKCKQSDIHDFKTIKKGLTNTSFIFTLFDQKYVYRHPGEGTSEIINRKHEYTSLTLAKQNNIDPTFLSMNPEEGWKISKYISNIREPDYRSKHDCQKVISTLQKLHALPVKLDWFFKPYEDALELERFIQKKEPIKMAGYDELKANISTLYKTISKNDDSFCLCHCDTYAPNWMINDEDEIYLIDWEYSAMSHPGVDVGYFMVDGEYTIKEANDFLKMYLGDRFCEDSFFTYLAWASIDAFYWFVWALYKESCGEVMGEALYRWYKMSKKYSDYLINKSSRN